MGVAAIAALDVAYDRFFLGLDPLTRDVPIIAIIIAIRTATNIQFGLYSRTWRYASIPDVVRIASAALMGSALVAATAFVLSHWGSVRSGSDLPVSFWLVESLLTLMVLAASRLTVRAASDWSIHGLPGNAIGGRATLLYGAGRLGVLVARSARRNPASGVVPVGFLDDDPALGNHFVDGLFVFGAIDALREAVARTGARSLLITMPDAAGTQIRKVVEAAIAVGLDVRTVPSMYELLDGTIDAQRARRVRVEDLLQRSVATHHAPEVDERIAGRTVLITGAGGSIGSELARQVWSISPRRLVLVDRAESSLYLIERELDGLRATKSGNPELRVHLGNVASRSAIDRLLAIERPDVVFHAAAYKHVPMLEKHPSDAVQVNVGGTMALLDAAASAGVERFVLVSTDKAVHPTSVMGASKRIAEMLVADTSRAIGRPYVSVRFGNVLGSAGSVVPIFQDQLEKGRPLTITHREMTRFFMTIPEASWLILDAAAIGRTGDLFVLDMGKPVRIVDLARDLVRLAGRDPDSQPIQFVGLRPGEKLHEELFYDAERVELTGTDRVLRAVAEPPRHDIRQHATRLLLLASGSREPELVELLFDIANEIPYPRTSGSRLGRDGRRRTQCQLGV